ncbi:MAG: carbon-nitrogen hydrolase family protein [Elusimicrobia bacterium]|nr:carbon-nitrogen hydrolase family protein [Elusimicrobiota bacterium]
MPRLPLAVEPVPLDLAWKDPDSNLAALEREVRARLARSPELPPEARLFLFPELTLTGFVTKDPPSYRVEPADPPLARLRELARSLGTGLAVGFPERNPADPARPFNALGVFAPDGALAGLYRKTHLFTLGREPESAVYAAGDAPVLLDYRGWKVGLAVCFDVRFSALFHAYAKAGADLVLVSSCWVGGPHKTYQYRTLCSAHAVLTQAYVAAVNRSGRDPAWEYDGSAYLFSPFGEDVLPGGARLLDPSELETCRKLAVRVADRDFD